MLFGYSRSIGRVAGVSVTAGGTQSTLLSARQGGGALGVGGGRWLLLLFSVAAAGTKASGCLKLGISGLRATSTGLKLDDGCSALL